MRTIISLSLFLSLTAWGDSFTQSRIHDIDYGTHPGDETLILLENGRVLRTSDNKDLQSLQNSFDKNNDILDVIEENPLPVAVASYEPGIVSGLATAEEYFNKSRDGLWDSQCFNRAHVWTYELWKAHQLKSQKIFLFFSRRYIRKHKFKWWFHVAPLLQVNEGSTLVERVIDSTFSHSSQDIKSWTSLFIGKKIDCPVIAQYSEYADYPFVSDCSLLKTPMYIHQPLDLEMQEIWGVEKTEFSPRDLTIAYEEAFNLKFTGEK